MRPREEIMLDTCASKTMMEVLLDLRELLIEKTKPKGKSREEWERQF